MTLPARKKAHVISTFSDAGTGESFTADDTPMIYAGTFANYEAAGLVRAAAAERAPKPTSARRSAPRRRAPATRAAPESDGVAPDAASAAAEEVATTE